MTRSRERGTNLSQMGTLLRLRDGWRFALPSRGVLGRSGAAMIALEDNFASGEHARISWTGSSWELRDLGSKNGTFINGAPLPAGSTRVVFEGDRFGFGENADRYRLEDARAPGPMAIELATNTWISGTGDLLQLPSSDDPRLTVFRDNSGSWCVEDEAGTEDQVNNRETIELDGRWFRLELPETSDHTPIADAAFNLVNVTIRFHVPASREKVALEVVHARRQQWLEPREHHYLLYTLAKERAVDRDRAEVDRGWRTTAWLVRTLNLDDAAINVLIHRARHHLASVGIEEAARIVEVKRGQRRFGSDRFEIIADEGR